MLALLRNDPESSTGVEKCECGIIDYMSIFMGKGGHT